MYSYRPIVVHFLRAFMCNRMSCIWSKYLMGGNKFECLVISGQLYMYSHFYTCQLLQHGCKLLEPNLSSFQTCLTPGLQWLVLAASFTPRPPSLRTTGQVIRSAQNVVSLWATESLTLALSGGHSPVRMVPKTDRELELPRTRCWGLAIFPPSLAAWAAINLAWIWAVPSSTAIEGQSAPQTELL